MHRCCHDDAGPISPASTRPPGAGATGVRRIARLFPWALPITTLVLVPKCPMCVAAYALLFTGVGLSLPAAAALRWGLITISIGALAFLLLRLARRALAPAA